MNYIPVTVYLFSLGDATNKGKSSRHKTLYFPHPKGWWKPNNISADQVLNLSENRDGTPVLRDTNRAMFGGNFAWSTDSRFRQLISESPLKIFDRYE